MVGAPAAARAVELARRLPRLAVGLHLALVDAEPVLPPSAVPDLIDERGWFRSNMARSGAAMFFLPHVRRLMRAEIRAQFEAFRATGLKLDHVTAHKHFHLHPSILSAVIELAKEFGAPAVRAPLEPRAALAEVEATGPRLSAFGPRAFGARSARAPQARGHRRARSGFWPRLERRHDPSAASRARGASARGAHGNLHASGDVTGLPGSGAGLSI